MAKKDKHGSEDGKKAVKTAPAKAKPTGQAKASKGNAGNSGGLGDKIGKSKEFFEEAKVELKKVTWPSRKETMQTGVAVLVLVIIMAIFLGVVDMGLSRLMEFILS
jgi:preprotein translocase subunit SecE